MDDTTDTGGGGVGESEGVDRCSYISEDGVCCGLPWDHEGLHSFEIDEMSGIGEAKAHLAKWVHRSPFIDALTVAYEERIKELEKEHSADLSVINYEREERMQLEAEVERVKGIYEDCRKRLSRIWGDESLEFGRIILNASNQNVENASLREQVKELNDKIIALEGAIEVQRGGPVYSAEEIEENASLRAEVERLKKQRDKAAQWAGVDIAELDEAYPPTDKEG